MISAHEANAQRVQAVGPSRETHPKKRNLRNEPMKCIDEMHPRGCVFRSFGLLCWQ